ncbi:uncharacterized protein LOC119369909 [Jatropha curcas]|uniref:uncharacterized protein LOC119369909 n=1 Tax=Jatropha curcas TaxID=180498 RepID=UPI001896123C|nr:uncharacterized protein LOC119369909 [Jatropha curcas]
MMESQPQGTLPSNTKKNPKEQVQAITLRSGKQLEEPPKKEKKTEEQKKVPIIDLEEQEEVKPYLPPVPFPQRLKKARDDKSFLKFLDVFKKLQINIPFAEALTQMPSYAKFLKDILSKKRQIDDQGTVMLTEEFFKMLGMGVAKPTRMSLQLADRSINIQEDYRRRACKDREGSLILGRPFLATARALIDVYESKLTLRVGQEEIIFDVLKSCKLPMDYSDRVRIDVVDECVEKHFAY